jgi:hypothetical protein
MLPKCKKFHFSKAILVFSSFFGRQKKRIVRHKFLPSSFYNLTTRGVFGPKFLKPKRSVKETGGGIGG